METGPFFQGASRTISVSGDRLVIRKDHGCAEIAANQMLIILIKVNGGSIVLIRTYQDRVG
jgi:hypothetical protein